MLRARKSSEQTVTKAHRSAALRVRALDQIRTLVASLSHSARAVERSTGITNAQLFLLQQLETSGPLSVNDLAARARTQQSTASIVVARLVRAGLAAKKKSPDDGRIAVISLTPNGRRLVRNAPAPPTSALLRSIEALSPGEAKSLENGVRALVRALGLEPPKVTMLFEDATTRRNAPIHSRGTATPKKRKKR
jgi:DNA-binding MarR family transcriptional regulator